MQALSIMNLKVDMGYIYVSSFALCNGPPIFIFDLLLIIGSWSKSLSSTYGNKTLAFKNSNAIYINLFLVLLLKFEEYKSI
jgi:hypothetical protein